MSVIITIIIIIIFNNAILPATQKPCWYKLQFMIDLLGW